jgi:hypothetical protein
MTPGNVKSDPNGNVTELTLNGKTYKYVFDFENRLIEAIYPDNLVLEFAYDGLGRRVLTRVNGEGMRYVYDGYLIVQERKERTDELVAEYTYFQGSIIKQKRGTEERWVYTHPEGGWPRHLFGVDGSKTDSLEYGWMGDLVFHLHPEGTEPTKIHFGWAGGWIFGYNTAMPFVMMPESNEVWMPKLGKSLNPMARKSWALNFYQGTRGGDTSSGCGSMGVTASTGVDPNTGQPCVITTVRTAARTTWAGQAQVLRSVRSANMSTMPPGDYDESLKLPRCCEGDCPDEPPPPPGKPVVFTCPLYAVAANVPVSGGQMEPGPLPDSDPDSEGAPAGWSLPGPGSWLPRLTPQTPATDVAQAAMCCTLCFNPISGAAGALIACTTALSLANPAQQWATSTSGNTTADCHDNPCDALRHCYWSCSLASNILTAYCAEGIGWAHELSFTTMEARCMDLHNNEIGRQCAATNASCGDCCLSALKSGVLWWMAPALSPGQPGGPPPPNIPGLPGSNPPGVIPTPC